MPTCLTQTKTAIFGDRCFSETETPTKESEWPKKKKDSSKLKTVPKDCI
jgi:hypothetical protein